MTSSVFSFDALDELLASSGSSLANATLPVSRSSGTAAETPSGESASVSLIGVSPGNKTFSLWFSGAPGSFCLGAIGSSKFCVKPVTNGTRCSVISHQTKKFSPETALGYLLDTEVRAFCAPCFNTSMLSPSQVLQLQGVQFTVPVWEDLFLQLSNHLVPKWLSFEEPTAGSLQQPPQHPLTAASLPPLLLSATAHEQSSGILALVPSLSFDDSVDSSPTVDWSVNADAKLITASLQKFHNHFASLKLKWKRAFTEVEASYGMVVQNIQHLHSFNTELRHDLGFPVVDFPAPSAWQGLTMITDQLQTMSSIVDNQACHLADLHDMNSRLQQAAADVGTNVADQHALLEAQVAAVSSDLGALETRVLKLVPLLQQLQRGALMVMV